MSSDGRYPRLFSALRVGGVGGVGGVTVENRIVFAAHLTNAADQGLPTPAHAAYYGARAAGGAGMVITSEHSVHPSDGAPAATIRGYDPAVVAGYRAITGAVHEHGAVVLAQLNHRGAAGSSRHSRRALWAPSALPDPGVREVPHAVSADEIAELVAGYALAARYAVDGGFDGVELQCAHASLVGAFVSGATNRRDDGYGGALEHRARLLLEVVVALRGAVGAGRVVGVRLCGDDLLPGGTRLDDAIAIARMLAACGDVDYLNTAIGLSSSSQDMITPGMRMPAGYALDLPRALKRAVALPVVGVGRLTTPAQAERALADGDADLIGIVRGQIADPDFAVKARGGRADEIRACLGCNQECIGRVGQGRWLGCTENPRAGREAVALPAPRQQRRQQGRRVVVVGGGPAGLQAAVTAAERSHRVTLLEAGDTLGGQVVEASRAPGREGLAHLVHSLSGAARRGGVCVRTGCPTDAAAVVELAPDVVVLATGAVPVRPAWASGIDQVVDVRDVLTGRVEPSGEVAVVDELGFHQATSVAEHLAARGCAVEVITSLMVVGQDLDATLDLRAWTRAACAAGITQSTDLVPVTAAAAGQGRVELSLLHHPTGAITSRAVDWVVWCGHQRPREELWHALSGLHDDLVMHRIGDCLAPRRLHAAIIEGERVGLGL